MTPLSEILTDAVACPVPEIEIEKALHGSNPAFTARFRGVAKFWLFHVAKPLKMPTHTVIREVISEIMNDGTENKLQKMLRAAVSEPLPEFDADVDDGNLHAITLRLSPVERHWVEHRAAALNMPASVFVGFLIQQYAKADLASMKGANT